MYAFEKWLSGRFPQFSDEKRSKFKMRFPRCPDSVIDFVSRNHGGRFPRMCDAAKSSYVSGVFGVETDFFPEFYDRFNFVVVERQKLESTRLKQAANDLLPLFDGLWSWNWLLNCESGEVIEEYTQEFTIEVLASSFDEYCKSIVLPEPDFVLENERGPLSEIEKCVFMCDDAGLSNISIDELAKFRDQRYSGTEPQWSIMHLVTSLDRVVSLVDLVKRGLNPISTDAFENSCHHIAAKGSVDTLKYLTTEFPHGIHLKNSDGHTPFEVAVRGSSERCAIWLANCGSKTDIKIDGIPLLEWLKLKDRRQLLSYFVNRTHCADFT